MFLLPVKYFFNRDILEDNDIYVLVTVGTFAREDMV